MSISMNSLREEETYGAVTFSLFLGQNRGFRRGEVHHLINPVLCTLLQLYVTGLWL